MAIRLKQSTASQEVPLGPFLDSTDGVTPETALTIANTDIKLWLMGATSLANKTSGGATHMAGGIYYCVLDATDTATLGALVIFVSVSGALPVKVECEVVTANVYDALIGGTDYLQVDVTDWKNATAPAMTGDAFARLGAPAGASVSADVAAMKVDTAAILVDTNELQTDWANGGRLDLILDARASQTSVDDLPTSAELATALGTADDATLAQIALVKADTAAILLDTGTDGVVVADKTGFRLSSTGVNDILRTALTEGYAADGATFTLEQGVYMLWALLAERGLSGTTLTAKKLDGATTAMTFTLDDGTTPTSQTRAT